MRTNSDPYTVNTSGTLIINSNGTNSYNMGATYLRKSVPNTVKDGTQLLIGQNAADTYRSLFAIDVSYLTNIVGVNTSRVDSAALVLTHNGNGSGGSMDASVYLTNPFDERYATWNNPYRTSLGDLTTNSAGGIIGAELKRVPVTGAITPGSITGIKEIWGSPSLLWPSTYSAPDGLVGAVRTALASTNKTVYFLLKTITESTTLFARFTDDAGAVLGDLCGDPDRQVPAESAAQAGAPVPAIAGAVAFLTHPFRFGADTGIGALSRAIRARDVAKALAYLRRQAREPVAPPDAGPYTDLAFEEPGPDAGPIGRAGTRRDVHAKGPDLFDRVRGRVIERFRPFLDAARQGDAARALEGQRDFCILTPHRKGRLGVEGLNARVEAWLAAGDVALIDPRDEWYVGRPILVTENDPGLELFNGDMGVIVRVDGQLRAAFPGSAEGDVRLLHPGRLPPHETVFAMTVHKSQGSQFAHVLVVLPERPSPILTRELLYTAVTRARTDVTVLGSPAVIERAIRESVLRFSGLRQKVWEPADPSRIRRSP